MEGAEKNNHSLLRGGRRQTSYSHGYSSAQIQSLASMCEALIPPLIPNENPLHKSLQTFYEASGSQSPIPDETAEMVVKKALPSAASLVSWVLKILSFRLGTLLLCGFICFDWKWPFLHKFSEMSLEKREAVLKKWSKQRRFVPLRLAFVLIKLFCFFTFFSRVMHLPRLRSLQRFEFSVHSFYSKKLSENITSNFFCYSKKFSKNVTFQLESTTRIHEANEALINSLFC